jgi:ketosteroid isomerase-like protein
MDQAARAGRQESQLTSGITLQKGRHRAALFVYVDLRQTEVGEAAAMMQRTEKERLLREMYEARVRKDFDAVSHFFAPDMHYHMMGSPDGQGQIIQAAGLDEFRPLTEELMKTFVLSDLHIRNIVIEGEKAVVHWQVRIESGSTGDVALTDLCDIIEFRNDRIYSFVEFCDTALAGRLMRGSTLASKLQ